MDEQAPLVDFSALDQSQLERLAAASAALRPYVPEVAREAVAQIRREVPQYAPPHDPRYARVLDAMVGGLIGHFVELMGDPRAPSGEYLGLARRVGAGEAREGRGLEQWQAAMRIGAGLAVGRLTDRAGRLGLGGTVGEIGQIARAVLAFTDRIAEAVAAGHAEAGARAAGERAGHRRALVDLLLAPDPSASELVEAAGRAGWELPHSVAAVALHSRDAFAARRPMLPSDALAALHLDEPCVIVPDPEGPGRRHQLETGLRDWQAAIGPPVGVTGVATSLRWARQALALARTGAVDAGKPIYATEHMPLIVMARERELVDLVAAERLAPLRRISPPKRRDLAETLLALIECRFNSTAVANRLRLHPQTIRYRLRRIEELFGSDLHEPALQLELHMTLRAWLAAHTPTPPDPAP